MASPWVRNSRCRACGHRARGEYSAFNTLCSSCAFRGRWAWQVWKIVVERRAGPFWRRHWEEKVDEGDEPFTTDREPGGYA